jgi:DNA-binding SARP family transcriptional activator
MDSTTSRCTVRLLTLGKLAVGYPDGTPVTGGTKDLLLLTRLARRAPRPVSRAELATLLWADRSDTRARHSLRQALVQLRRVLGDSLRTDADHVWIEPSVVEVDGTLLELHSAAGRHREALELYRGPFLPGCEGEGGEDLEEWVLTERETLRTRYIRSLQLLTSELRARSRWSDAAELAERWAVADPLSEAAHRALVETLHLAGRTRDALVRHVEFSVRVRVELRREPTGAFAELGDRYSAVLEAADGGRLALDSSALFTPELVGRARPLAILCDYWLEARTGHEGRAVLVEGEEGAGRSRLVEEFIRAATSPEPILVLHARARAHQREAAWGAARELLDGLASAPGLAAAPTADLAEAAALLPSIAERFPDLPHGTGEERCIHRAVLRLLEEVAREVPTILVQDDYPRADATSRKLLRFLAERPPPGVLVLLTGCSDELRDPDPPQLPGVRIPLDSLTEEDVQVVIASMLAVSAADGGALARSIHGRSGGNALFTCELLRALVDEGQVATDTHGVWAAAVREGEGDLSLPHTLHEAVARRLARLGPSAHAVVSAAAVLHGAFDADVLEELTALPADELAEALDALVARGLLAPIDSTPERYEFAHEVTRRAAYQGLGASRRRMLHHAAARASGSTSPEVPPIGLRSWLDNRFLRSTAAATAVVLVAVAAMLAFW